jgi:hypothetical protein
MPARWLGILAALALPPATAAAQAPQPSPQALFEATILADPGTTDAIAAMLRTDAAHVTARPTFADLTGDRREDAVVTVVSGGAAGAVAVYTLSSDGTKSGRLRVVFRTQSLFRARTKVAARVLTVLQPDFAMGDDLCCPAARVERDYAWEAGPKRLRHRATRRISLRD